MGLTSLWSNFTGPRVTEITPQTQCSWLEKNRPQSSRTAKKLPHLNLKPNIDKDSRPKTSHEMRKKKRTLSISRPKLIEESNKEYRVSATQGADIPEVPTLPPALSPRSKGPSEDAIRPGTAITTSTTERSDLAGHGLPSPTFHSPLPSPRSPVSWRSREHMASLRSEADGQIDNDSGLRSRSNSTASGRSKHKRASWFVSGKKKSAEAVLPPPLPPPSGLPPPVPLVQPLVAELPDTRPPTHRDTPHEDVPERPISPVTKSSLDGDSIIDAFPSVPTPLRARESSRTLEAIQRNSTIIQDSNLLTSPDTTFANDSNGKKLSPTQSMAPKGRTIAAPTQTIDGLLAPEVKKEVPKHDSKQLPALPPEATEPTEATAKRGSDNRKSLSFGQELQQEYDRLMHNIGKEPVPDAVKSVMEDREFSPEVAESLDSQKFSNDEALSKLEFGILK